MFRFSFGSGYYERQYAVVMAETMEEARAILFADMERQAEIAPRRNYSTGNGKSSNRIDGNYLSPEGWSDYWFTAEMMAESEEDPCEVVGPVTYLIGADG